MKAAIRYPVVLGIILCSCLGLLGVVYLGSSLADVDLTGDPEVNIRDGTQYRINRNDVVIATDHNWQPGSRALSLDWTTVYDLKPGHHRQTTTTGQHGSQTTTTGQHSSQTTTTGQHGSQTYREVLINPVKVKPTIIIKTRKPSKIWKPASGIGLNMMLHTPQRNVYDIKAKMGISGLSTQVNATESDGIVLPKNGITKSTKRYGNIFSAKYVVESLHKNMNEIVINHVDTPSKKDVNMSLMCDMEKLELDDTDVHNVVDKCQFPEISRKYSVEKTMKNLSPMNIPLLPHYKNPCWYESLPIQYKQEYRPKRCMFPDQAERSFSKILPVLDKRASQLKYPWRLRCLPLVYIIGVAKCGTSDLFYTLATHPQITIGATKEPFFWDWGLWKTSMPNTLLDYLNLYDQAAERIRQLTTTQPQNGMSVAYHPMVTMDGSVNTLFEFGGSSVLPGNVGHSEPRYIAAHMIKNLTPKSDIKVILIIRNPTERLFSSYVFFNTVTHPNNISREEFHRLASASIRRLNQCFVSRNLSACLYDKSVIKTYKTVDVHAGVYYGFIKDWITVFPHMRIVRLEDYKFNRQDIIKDIIQYIGLDPFHNKLSESTKHVGKGPKQTFKMLPQTKKMLDDFYRPFNKRLAVFMGNEKLLFET